MDDPLQHTSHRPWPLPQSPWTFYQEWHDLMFVHWPMAPEALSPFIPPGLILETWEGEAWIAVVPFRLEKAHPRILSPVPWFSHFGELNLRTYVRVDDKPGVFFFSLDASNWLAVALARRFLHLPYYWASMSSLRNQEDRIKYSSTRIHPGALPASFEAEYGPTGPSYTVDPGSLEEWLIERYCLYSVNSRMHIFRIEIHHVLWPLQPAEADIRCNTILGGSNLALPDREPVLHFARKQEVVSWNPYRV